MRGDESGFGEDYPTTNENISTVVAVLAALAGIGFAIGSVAWLIWG